MQKNVETLFHNFLATFDIEEDDYDAVHKHLTFTKKRLLETYAHDYDDTIEAFLNEIKNVVLDDLTHANVSTYIDYLFDFKYHNEALNFLKGLINQFESNNLYYKYLLFHYLEHLNYIDDAIALGEQILALDPADEYTIRHTLSALYLHNKAFEKVLALQENYREDHLTFDVTSSIINYHQGNIESSKQILCSVYQTYPKFKRLVNANSIECLTHKASHESDEPDHCARLFIKVFRRYKGLMDLSLSIEE